jgi:hypothetical protein
MVKMFWLSGTADYFETLLSLTADVGNREQQ